MRILGVLFFIMGTLCAMAQTEVIAHRGYWKTDGSSQNSIRALVKADSIACYGSEFDVWLTADDVLVVNHDAVFKGVEIETSQSKDARAILLSNGENLPSLKQYLQAGKDCTTRLVFELKPHKNRLQEAKAVIDGIMMVDRMGLNDRVEYITFSADALEEFIKYAPKGTPVYYLNGEKTPQELHKLGAAGMDYNIRVFKKHPEWIKECHDLGMKVNVWTVNKEEDMKWCIEQGVDFITTNEPELLQKLLKK
ncbi:MAG: glycerophosphodiester phosphodiesterase family protein [Muribaculaceae bacterium]|jgi:glycerophosphoryl diester phosphodiesterase|nr:glycerophosphodiester phosphodiesterase family protein [Muribaculaceae bacterium]